MDAIPIPPAPPVICPSCGVSVPPGFSFCPNCGKPLKATPISTTILSQTGIYLLSVFLPPLGLWPGIKYFRHGDPKAKQIGMIAVGLTVLSTIVTVWLTFSLLNVYLNTFNDVLNGGLPSPIQ